MWRRSRPWVVSWRWSRRGHVPSEVLMQLRREGETCDARDREGNYGQGSCGSADQPTAQTLIETLLPHHSDIPPQCSSTLDRRQGPSHLERTPPQVSEQDPCSASVCFDAAHACMYLCMYLFPNHTSSFKRSKTRVEPSNLEKTYTDAVNPWPA